MYKHSLKSTVTPYCK